MTISFLKLPFLRKKYPPVLTESLTGGNHTIECDSTQCSVFSVLEKSTTTDTMLHSLFLGSRPPPSSVTPS